MGTLPQFTPFIPGNTSSLEDLALDIVQKSAALGGRQHKITLRSLRDLLRVINSYYSNQIEGNNIHPFDIVRAMNKDYDVEPAKRNLQQESVAHIEVQKRMEARLEKESDLVVTSADYLKFLHYEFYSLTPDEFRVVTDPQTGKKDYVIPGEFRHSEVQVGRHIPPCHSDISLLMDRFNEAYLPARHHGVKKLIAAAAAHHRLMWLHPFLDGNGRVARLFTESYLLNIPVEGFGIWSVSRGLARKSTEYKATLSHADAQRRNDLDGRGNLSDEGLSQFCHFFLKTCLDQVDYMNGLLQLDGMVDRIKGYIELRNKNMAFGPSNVASPLKMEAANMLQEVLVRGEISRGEICAASGLKERTARELLGQLIEENLLLTNSPKGPVRMGFPVHVAGWIFPELYPRQ